MPQSQAIFESKELSVTAKAWRGVIGHWKSMVNSSLPTRPNFKQSKRQLYKTMKKGGTLKCHKDFRYLKDNGLLVITIHELEILH